MSPELFSGILLAILAIVLAANIARSKVGRSERNDEPSTKTAARKAIDSYTSNDADSRFVRELDLVPLKILSKELGVAPKKRKRTRS